LSVGTKCPRKPVLRRSNPPYTAASLRLKRWGEVSSVAGKKKPKKKAGTKGKKK